MPKDTLADIRRDMIVFLQEVHDADLDEDAARVVLDEIMAVTVHDMPPSSDLVAILLETASQRQGGVSWADVWRSIGVNPNRGRDLIARNAHALDWPVWYTLRQAAIGQATSACNART